MRQPKISDELESVLEVVEGALWKEGYRLSLSNRTDDEWRNRRRSKNCVGCGKPFNSRRRETKYCSKECFHFWRPGSTRKHVKVTPIVERTRRCLGCGKHFIVQRKCDRKKFCDRYCYALWREGKPAHAVAPSVVKERLPDGATVQGLQEVRYNNRPKTFG